MIEVKKRVWSLDILRIIAVGCVVMLHVSYGGVSLFNIKSTYYWVASILYGLTCMAVPLFVMISGALMLNEDKKITNRSIFKRIVKFIFILFIWAFIYAIFEKVFKTVSHGKTVNVCDVIIYMIEGHYHLWYMFMLIGLYLITPILRLFVKRENKNYVKYFILIAVAVQFIEPAIDFIIKLIYPTAANYYMDFINKFHISFVCKYVTYYLLGWYFTNIEINKSKRVCIYIIGLVGMLFTVIGIPLFLLKGIRLDNVFYNNLSINVLSYSSMFFLFVLLRCRNLEVKNDKYARGTIELSKLSFGVYLIHDIIRQVLNGLIVSGNLLVNCVLIFVITFILSYVLTYILSKIPIVKKIINY